MFSCDHDCDSVVWLVCDYLWLWYHTNSNSNQKEKEHENKIKKKIWRKNKVYHFQLWQLAAIHM